MALLVALYLSIASIILIRIGRPDGEFVSYPIVVLLAMMWPVVVVFILPGLVIGLFLSLFKREPTFSKYVPEIGQTYRRWDGELVRVVSIEVEENCCNVFIEYSNQSRPMIAWSEPLEEWWKDKELSDGTIAPRYKRVVNNE